MRHSTNASLTAILVPIFAVGLTVGLAVAGTSTAHAHQASMTHARVTVAHDQRSVRYQLKCTPADLSEALGLGADIDPGDAQIAAGQDTLLDYVLSRLHVTDGERSCPIERLGARPVIQGGRFIEVAFRVECPAPIRTLAIDYELFFDLDPMHRGMLHVSYRDEQAVAELRADGNRFVWDLDEPPPDSRLGFIGSGIEHIALGYDHVAFLLGLLLVVPLARRRPGETDETDETDETGETGETGESLEIRGLRRGLRYTAVIVTSFTVAHSITLIAASLGWISLSARLVESLIAASIVFVAVENIVRPDPRYRHVLTFGFGLVHGLGFASVLAVLLPPADIIWPLLMFNIGVELGQFGIVLLALPLLHLNARVLGIREYRAWPLTLGSGALALLGLAWLLERVFDITVLGL